MNENIVLDSTLSIFDLAVDFIGYGRPAAGRPYPMKSTAKSKMDKVESEECAEIRRLLGRIVKTTRGS